jgi:hypothetical protein
MLNTTKSVLRCEQAMHRYTVVVMVVLVDLYSVKSLHTVTALPGTSSDNTLASTAALVTPVETFTSLPPSLVVDFAIATAPIPKNCPEWVRLLANLTLLRARVGFHKHKKLKTSLHCERGLLLHCAKKQLN